MQQIVTAVVKPSAKAFAYAYLYIVLPKLIKTLASRDPEKWAAVRRLLKRGFHPSKFPTFAASFVGGTHLLEPLLAMVAPNKFTATLAAGVLSALINFPRYQRHVKRFLLVDLTLIMATRAFDTAFSYRINRLVPAPIGDGALFVVACALIMYSWFFEPQTLPPAYRNWITAAANMDTEIVDVLKALRDRTVQYGKPGPDILGPYCERYGQDRSKGDLVVNQPLPCEAVHAFKCKNCELHALWRFWRGFVFAVKVYAPLNGLVWLLRRPPVLELVKSTLRSLLFLGAYIGLYWYAVCLTRTRLAPKLFPGKDTKWDVTYAPTAGAVACGFSSFIETAARRKELALFVTPRAIGTLVMEKFSEKNHMAIENLVFSLLMGVLVAYSRWNPRRVRGIFGRGLAKVL